MYKQMDKYQEGLNENAFFCWNLCYKKDNLSDLSFQLPVSTSVFYL